MKANQEVLDAVVACKESARRVITAAEAWEADPQNPDVNAQFAMAVVEHSAIMKQTGYLMIGFAKGLLDEEVRKLQDQVAVDRLVDGR